MRRIALVIEYEGTAYAGSQRQANAPSIQAAVEGAIASLTGHPARLHLAGRTDAGVHALGQVAAFDTASALAVDRFVRGLNYYLPQDIAAKAAYDVPASFDPRRHAASRVYRYSFGVSPGRSALRRAFVHHVRRPLDVSAMTRALACLEGTRDFAPFSGVLPAGRTTRRTMLRTLAWREGAETHLELEANAFLPQQVRRIAAAVLDIGLGRRTLAAFQALAATSRQGAATQILPANGLCLREVKYPVPLDQLQESHATDTHHAAHPAQLTNA